MSQQDYQNRSFNFTLNMLADLLAGRAKATYSATGKFTPAATPTDLVTFFGSATKICKLLAFKIGTQNTAAGSQEFTLIKRSTANTGGTFVAAAAISQDSADPAATAVVGHWTANPGVLGNVVGNLRIIRVASPVLVPGSFAAVALDPAISVLPIAADGDPIPKPIVLNTALEGVAINFGGAALVAGQIHTWEALWTEEAAPPF